MLLHTRMNIYKKKKATALGALDIWSSISAMHHLLWQQGGGLGY